MRMTVSLIFFPGDAEVEATENWFGGKDVNESSKRVYDKSRDTSLLPVSIDPVTIDWPLYCFLNMDCKAPRGSCVGSGSCVCHPGEYCTFFLSFFYPLLLWVFLVCFTCYALIHIRGHSHSPPLIRHYVSYPIRPLPKSRQGTLRLLVNARI